VKGGEISTHQGQNLAISAIDEVRFLLAIHLELVEAIVLWWRRWLFGRHLWKYQVKGGARKDKLLLLRLLCFLEIEGMSPLILCPSLIQPQKKTCGMRRTFKA